MATRLPTPGSDAGQWGNILNEFLAQSHTADGALKPNVVGASQLQDNSVGSAQLQDNAVTAATITPGTITKVTIGLDSVDNTADTAKPVSTAQQAALDLKAPLASPTFTGTVSGITKAHVGLGSVDNTSDAAKPISTATQAALDTKAVINNSALNSTQTWSGTEIASRDTIAKNRAYHTGTQLASTISDLDSAVLLHSFTDFFGASSDISMNLAYRILELADPVDPGDATNKTYVDTADALNGTLTDTAANFALVGSAANTIGKYEGRPAFDTTNDRPVWASGAAADATWKYADGTLAFTPV